MGKQTTGDLIRRTIKRIERKLNLLNVDYKTVQIQQTTSTGYTGLTVMVHTPDKILAYSGSYTADPYNQETLSKAVHALWEDFNNRLKQPNL